MAAKTGTYTLIASSTLGSATNSVTFSSIPATYTDLILVMNIKAASSTYPRIRVNGDSGSNYSSTLLRGDGSTALSRRQTNVSQFDEFAYNTLSTTQFVPVIVNFNDYANGTTYKTFLARTSDAGQEVMASVGLWRSTSAINSIAISTNNSVNFTVDSTFKLYGIEAGNQ